MSSSGQVEPVVHQIDSIASFRFLPSPFALQASWLLWIGISALAHAIRCTQSICSMRLISYVLDPFGHSTCEFSSLDLTEGCLKQPGLV